MVRRIVLVCLATLLLGVSIACAPIGSSDLSSLQPRHQELTEKQAIYRLIESAGYWPTQAEILLNGYANSQTEVGTIEYWEYVLPHDFGAGKVAEVGCIYAVHNLGAKREVLGIVATWSRACGKSSVDGAITWREFYKFADHDSSSVLLMARGAIEVKVPQGPTTYYDRTVESWTGTITLAKGQ